MTESSNETEPHSETPVEPSSEEGFGRKMLQQAFELWLNPELERRKAAGRLPEPFSLQAAQRIQWPDGAVLVRINDEVRGIGNVRATRTLEKGDPIFEFDLEGIVDFDLIEEELDCGHWTVIWTGTGWFTSFNFLSNRARCLDLLAKASQFLESAVSAKRRGSAAVAVDNLFSACELASKAELVASHVVDLDAKTHKVIATRLNSWRKLGNINGAFVDLFNRLHTMRPFYRYEPNQSDPMPVTDDDIEVVEQVISFNVQRLSPAGRREVPHRR